MSITIMKLHNNEIIQFNIILLEFEKDNSNHLGNCDRNKCKFVYTGYVQQAKYI